MQFNIYGQNAESALANVPSPPQLEMKTLFMVRIWKSEQESLVAVGRVRWERRWRTGTAFLGSV